MKNIFEIIENLLKLFLDNQSINKIKCFYYVYFVRPDFKITFKNNYFEVKLKNNIILKFYDSPFGDLLYPLKGYLKNYEIKEGDYVVDAGAYIGTFAIYVAKIVGDKGRVIAFEPDKSNFNKLLKNIKLNDVNNIIAINKGLWNKNETLKFDRRKSKSSMMVECMDNKTQGEVVDYKFVKLDDELKKIGINKIDFIKMDIEGAEIEAVKGCRDILNNNNVNLAIASYHIRNGKMTCKKIADILNDVGYRSKTEFPKHLTTYSLKK